MAVLDFLMLSHNFFTLFYSESDFYEIVAWAEFGLFTLRAQATFSPVSCRAPRAQHSSLLKLLFFSCALFSIFIHQNPNELNE